MLIVTVNCLHPTNCEAGDELYHCVDMDVPWYKAIELAQTLQDRGFEYICIEVPTSVSETVEIVGTTIDGLTYAICPN
jgi:hypothetical protein